MSVTDVVCDAEPHFFKFWDAEGDINPFLVETTLNGKKTSLLVGGSDLCIEITKYPAITFSHICEKLFIVHLVLRGEFVQVDPGGA